MCRLQTGLIKEPVSLRKFHQKTTTTVRPLRHPHQVQLLNVNVSAQRKAVRKAVRKPQASSRAKHRRASHLVVPLLPTQRKQESGGESIDRRKIPTRILGGWGRLIGLISNQRERRPTNSAMQQPIPPLLPRKLKGNVLTALPSWSGNFSLLLISTLRLLLLKRSRVVKRC